ncbi:MAG TPA: ABC transporter permease [Pirellulales bacterium]|nr:ABC transporter permease [Pirellulales bacterium]
MVIEPDCGWQGLGISELWRSRELIYFLAWRDVKLRYRQTLLGAAWAMLQPTLMMLVFTLVIGRLPFGHTSDVAYPLFAFTGLMAWSFFATAVSSAAQSVVNAERLVTKIYFPRLAIPVAAVAAGAVDLAAASLVWVALMSYYHQRPGWTIVFAPLAVVLLALAALGSGILLAALNVRYRDVRYALPFFMQLWLFATPSIYLDRSVDEDATSAVAAQDPQPAVASGAEKEGGRRNWLALNPLDGLILFFRATLLGRPAPWRRLIYSTIAVLALLLAGGLYFRRVESSFADVI